MSIIEYTNYGNAQKISNLVLKLKYGPDLTIKIFSKSNLPIKSGQNVLYISYRTVVEDVTASSYIGLYYTIEFNKTIKKYSLI